MVLQVVALVEHRVPGDIADAPDDDVADLALGVAANDVDHIVEPHGMTPVSLDLWWVVRNPLEASAVRWPPPGLITISDSHGPEPSRDHCGPQRRYQRTAAAEANGTRDRTGLRRPSTT